MAEESGIEWTRSTFNPWIGCMKVSPGCDHCYAEREDKRGIFGGGALHWGPGVPRYRTSVQNWNKVRRWNREAAKTGEFWPVFTASLADIFDNEVPDEWRADFWQLVKECEHLTFLVLTKRISNVKRMLPPDWGNGYPNVRLGISVVNQEEADRDIFRLLITPARCRWLSMEPLLERVVIPEVFLKRLHFDGNDHDYPDGGGMIDWIVVGGESGAEARAMHPDWVRDLRDQCVSAGVPFLFKQWGEWVQRGPEEWGYPVIDGVPRFRMTDAGCNGQVLGADGGNEVWMNRAGKKLAGRMLDGRTWDEYPTWDKK